jgi:ketosteroid isomerase-like protein
MKKTIILSALVIAVAACQPKQLSEEDAKAIVKQQNEKLEEAFKSGDSEKLAAMYSADAKLCANDVNQIFKGRDAIKKFWASEMEGSKLVDMETETASVDASGDIIYETGIVTNKIEFQDSVYAFKAKYANIWKKQSDGTYLLDVDIWNGVGEN